ncbi:MAG TPA: PilW family protein [Thermoanaerobaculia bacterium]|nr:PilW family protein [Thermoanaerobaculia bacterium]
MAARATLRREAGFTVIEAVVTLAVMAPILLGLYSLLDSSNRITKQESNVAQAQQASRGGIYEVARMIRQARVGQLYYGNSVLPIYDNAPAGKTIKDLNGASHKIRQGTDVIEARGVILGEKFTVTAGDVTCSGACDGTSQVTVIIRSTASNGAVNYAANLKPSLASKTRPFYLVVADSSSQPVVVSGKTYLVPLYYVGLVSADSTGGWYTYSSDGTNATFTFTMNPSDTGAKVLNATAAGSPALQSAFICGVVDDLLFFVDEGTASVTGDTHPTLAMANYDPSSGNYDIQALVDEVEDFQVAYGVDGADSSTPDGGADPVKVDVTGAGKDEWVGNVAGESDTVLGTPAASIPRTGSIAAFVDTTVPTSDSAPALGRPLLRAVWLSLVVKSRDPDLKYDGPGARGVVTLDSTAKSMSDASITGRPYRRRVQSLAVSLRNFQ